MLFGSETSKVLVDDWPPVVSTTLASSTVEQLINWVLQCCVLLVLGHQSFKEFPIGAMRHWLVAVGPMTRESGGFAGDWAEGVE